MYVYSTERERNCKYASALFTVGREAIQKAEAVMPDWTLPVRKIQQEKTVNEDGLARSKDM